MADFEFLMKAQISRKKIVFPKLFFVNCITRVGISVTTAKSRQRKFVPSSHPEPFAVVATSRKSQTKVGTLACFDLL